MKFRLIALFLNFLFVLSLNGQDNEDQLAAQFFADKQYEKAADLYEKLSQKNTNVVLYYENYLECLYQLKKFDDAEKTIKKRVKKFEDNWGYKVDFAVCFDRQQKPNKSKDVLSKYIQNLKSDHITLLADALVQRGYYEEAILTYEKGRSLILNPIAFAPELAAIYIKTNNKEKAFNEYLNLILDSDLNTEQVQSLVQQNVTDNNDIDILKIEIIKRLQKNPDAFGLSELLKWAFVQQKDWEGAFIQTRALDKRLKEDGYRLLDLAELCLSNDAFTTAAKCYEYVKSLGTDRTYYRTAEAGLLNTRYQQLAYGMELPEAEKKALENDFLQFLNSNGLNEQTVSVARQLAQFYLIQNHNPQSAIEWLTKVNNTPGITNSYKALVKLDLGDCYLADDDLYEPQLLYSQVEKDFKEESIGQEAKFRNARLAYFRGEFDWAQTQLDVLKGATTQLISNNAIRLSLVILENLGLDSNYDAMELYSRADLFIYQNKLSEALITLDSIPMKYPSHSLVDEILFSKARIAERSKNWELALEHYNKIIKDYSYDILADNSLYNAGMIYENKLNQPEKAKEMYEKIILSYTGSLFVVDARKKFRKLRGDNIQKTDSNNDYFFEP